MWTPQWLDTVNSQTRDLLSPIAILKKDPCRALLLTVKASASVEGYTTIIPEINPATLMKSFSGMTFKKLVNSGSALGMLKAHLALPTFARKYTK